MVMDTIPCVNDLSDQISNTRRTFQGSRYAITVRHASMEYRGVLGAFSSKSSQTTDVVLKDLNMTVQRGTM